jgi:hypothetical protein
MMERLVTWAITRAVEDEIDDSVAMAALMGAALDTATFAGLGVPATGAVVAGAVTGASLNVAKKIRKRGTE